MQSGCRSVWEYCVHIGRCCNAGCLWAVQLLAMGPSVVEVAGYRVNEQQANCVSIGFDDEFVECSDGPFGFA